MSEDSPTEPDEVDGDGLRSLIDPVSAFADLARIRFADHDLQQVLTRVATLARDVIPRTTDVSVTLVIDGVAGTAAYTGDLALALDEAQYDSGYGPCLDAAQQQTVHVIADMTLETRWRAFTADAIRHGAAASLSVGIPVHDSATGAMNIYSDRVAAFDDDAVLLAQTFAGYAAVAMANASLYATTAALADQMAQAMASRAVIEQAKGILMARQQLNADEAFEVLSKASQAANRKLRDIAQAMVDGAPQAPSASSRSASK